MASKYPSLNAKIEKPNKQGLSCPNLSERKIFEIIRKFKPKHGAETQISCDRYKHEDRQFGRKCQRGFQNARFVGVQRARNDVNRAFSGAQRTQNDQNTTFFGIQRAENGFTDVERTQSEQKQARLFVNHVENGNKRGFTSVEHTQNDQKHAFVCAQRAQRVCAKLNSQKLDSKAEQEFAKWRKNSVECTTREEDSFGSSLFEHSYSQFEKIPFPTSSQIWEDSCEREQQLKQRKCGVSSGEKDALMRKSAEIDLHSYGEIVNTCFGESGGDFDGLIDDKYLPFYDDDEQAEKTAAYNENFGGIFEVLPLKTREKSKEDLLRGVFQDNSLKKPAKSLQSAPEFDYFRNERDSSGNKTCGYLYNSRKLENTRGNFSQERTDFKISRNAPFLSPIIKMSRKYNENADISSKSLLSIDQETRLFEQFKQERVVPGNISDKTDLFRDSAQNTLDDIWVSEVKPKQTNLHERDIWVSDVNPKQTNLHEKDICASAEIPDQAKFHESAIWVSDLKPDQAKLYNSNSLSEIFNDSIFGKEDVDLVDDQEFLKGLSDTSIFYDANASQKDSLHSFSSKMFSPVLDIMSSYVFQPKEIDQKILNNTPADVLNPSYTSISINNVSASIFEKTCEENDQNRDICIKAGSQDTIIGLQSPGKEQKVMQNNNNASLNQPNDQKRAGSQNEYENLFILSVNSSESLTSKNSVLNETLSGMDASKAELENVKRADRRIKSFLKRGEGIKVESFDLQLEEDDEWSSQIDSIIENLEDSPVLKSSGNSGFEWIFEKIDAENELQPDRTTENVLSDVKGKCTTQIIKQPRKVNTLKLFCVDESDETESLFENRVEATASDNFGKLDGTFIEANSINRDKSGIFYSTKCDESAIFDGNHIKENSIKSDAFQTFNGKLLEVNAMKSYWLEISPNKTHNTQKMLSPKLRTNECKLKGYTDLNKANARKVKHCNVGKTMKLRSESNSESIIVRSQKGTESEEITESHSKKVVDVRKRESQSHKVTKSGENYAKKETQITENQSQKIRENKDINPQKGTQSQTEKEQERTETKSQKKTESRGTCSQKEAKNKRTSSQQGSQITKKVTQNKEKDAQNEGIHTQKKTEARGTFSQKNEGSQNGTRKSTQNKDNRPTRKNQTQNTETLPRNKKAVKAHAIIDTIKDSPTNIASKTVNELIDIDASKKMVFERIVSSNKAATTRSCGIAKRSNAKISNFLSKAELYLQAAINESQLNTTQSSLKGILTDYRKKLNDTMQSIDETSGEVSRSKRKRKVDYDGSENGSRYSIDAGVNCVCGKKKRVQKGKKGVLPNDVDVLNASLDEDMLFLDNLQKARLSQYIQSSNNGFKRPLTRSLDNRRDIEDAFSTQMDTTRSSIFELSTDNEAPARFNKFKKTNTSFTYTEVLNSMSQPYLEELSSVMAERGFNETSIDLAQVFDDMNALLIGVNLNTDHFTDKTVAFEVEVVKREDSPLSASQSRRSHMLAEGLKRALQEQTSTSTTNATVNKLDVLNKIKDVIAALSEDVKQGKKLSIALPRYDRLQHVVFENDVLTYKRGMPPKRIFRNNKSSQRRFKLVVYLLLKVYTLIMTGSFCTKREIYYQIVTRVTNERQINGAYDDVCCLLDTPPWILGIMPSSRGIVYGNLTLTINKTKISCNKKGGISIPQDIHFIRKIETDAKFILIVEKEASFQKLLDEDIHNNLTQPFILITGRGYPDTNTRLLSRRLSDHLKLPMFILVDADPYGIEIMLSYRFGSASTSFLSHELALPHLRWLGIHPSEVNLLNINNFKLTQNDAKKINSILKRPYIDAHPQIRWQVQYMKMANSKAEIEGVIKCNHSLSNFYIPNKLSTLDFY